MWQQSSGDFTSKGNVPDSEKKCFEDSSSGQQDSGIVDSGFLSSGGNFLTSSELSAEAEETYGGVGGTEGDGARVASGGPAKLGIDSSGRTEAVAPEPMRADSGLDLGLSESLSQLSLKQVNLNQLGRGKVQSEPTVELRPVSHKPDESRNRNVNEQHRQSTDHCPQFTQEPWELYYTQDDDGDT